MAKKKDGPIEDQIKDVPPVDNIEETKELVVMKAVIKDGFCNYTYKVLMGIGKGAKHNVTGPGIVNDSMYDAFASFNVHLASIDDIFKHSGIEIADIDTMHGHELATIFNVTGFEIKGEQSNESIILFGNKYISSAGGRIELSTPKIPLDNLSSYKWYNELITVLNNARNEVELYHGGNYTVKEQDEKEEMVQTKITFGPGDANNNHSDEEFENGKV